MGNGSTTRSKTNKGWWEGPLVWMEPYPIEIMTVPGQPGFTMQQWQFRVATVPGVPATFQGKFNGLGGEIYYYNPIGHNVFIRYDFIPGDQSSMDPFFNALDTLASGYVPEITDGSRVIYGDASDLESAGYSYEPGNGDIESNSSSSDGSTSVATSGSGSSKKPDTDQDEEDTFEKKGVTITIGGRKIEIDLPAWLQDAAGGGSSDFHIPWGDPDWEEMERKRGPLGPTILWIQAEGFELVADGVEIVNEIMAEGLEAGPIKQ